MIRSMQSAIAGLKAHQTKMDVVGNNIANVNTWGFKNKSANFADAMYQNFLTGTGGNTTAGNLGGVNTSQIGYGANMNSIVVNTQTGTQSYTGRPGDCMINGPAYFIVGSFAQNVNAAGIEASGLSLSRVGIFNIDNNGYLVDDKGNYVYGYTTGTGDGNGNITVDTTTDLTPINVRVGIADNPAGGQDQNLTYSSMTIATDGTVTIVDQDSVPHVIGRIAVATVENPAGLEQNGGFLYNIGDNAGAVTVGGTNAATGDILSNYLEMSNVDLATEMSNMITTQRGYQANTKMITVSDEMLETLVNMKR